MGNKQSTEEGTQGKSGLTGEEARLRRLAAIEDRYHQTHMFEGNESSTFKRRTPQSSRESSFKEEKQDTTPSSSSATTITKKPQQSQSTTPTIKTTTTTKTPSTEERKKQEPKKEPQELKSASKVLASAGAKSSTAKGVVGDAVKKESGVSELSEHEVICSVFEVDVKAFGGKKGYFYLDELVQELKQEGTPLELNRELLDRMILGRCQSRLEEDKLSYLIDCYERMQKLKARKESLNKRIKDNKFDLNTLFDEIEQIIVSYFCLVSASPEVIGLEDRELVKNHFIEVLKNYRFLNLPEFMNKVCDMIEQDYGLGEVFNPIFLDMSLAVRGATITKGNAHMIANLQILTSLCRHKGLATAYTIHPDFIPQVAMTGAQVPTSTLLGPFLCLSSFPQECLIKDEYFSDVTKLRSIEPIQNRFRDDIRTVQTAFHEFIKTLCRGGDAAKKRVVEWFALAVNLNRSREKMMAWDMMSANNGFMCNLCSILLKMCDPFTSGVDRGFSKMDRIDTNYVLDGAINYSTVTALQGEIPKRDTEDWNRDFSFQSDMFFLTMECLHLSFKKCHNDYLQLLKNLQKEQQKSPKNPTEACKDLYGLKMTSDIQLFEKNTLKSLASFVTYAAIFFLREIRKCQLGGEFDSGRFETYQHLLNELALPIQEEMHPSLLILPEHYIADLLETVQFYNSISEKFRMFNDDDCHILLSFFAVIMDSTTILANPHMRGKIIELFYFVVRSNAPDAKVFKNVYNQNSFLKTDLSGSLARMYIYVEKTGSSNQFFEKFSFRFMITDTLEYLWRLPGSEYTDAFIYWSANNMDIFKNFVNFLINDMTWLLDQSLEYLTTIKEFEDLQTNPNPDMTEEEMKSMQEKFQEAERYAKSNLDLGNSNVKLLSFISVKLKDPFLIPEVVDKLTACLNYYVTELVTKRGLKVKVAHPEKYGFDPVVLLRNILQTYLNFGEYEVFQKSVASDGRSYNFETMEKAIRVCQKKGGMILNEVEVEKFRDLIQLIEALSQSIKAEDEALESEAPEEFLDPIIGHLMLDPVKLPSGHVMDRNTIAKHLINDPCDPYNRKEMTMDDVVPDEDLKKRIEEYIASKKNGEKPGTDQKEEENKEEDGEGEHQSEEDSNDVQMPQM